MATRRRPTLGPGDEVDLAEELARLEQGEREGAVGGRPLDGDLALLEQVEVGALAAVGEDQRAAAALPRDRGGELEDLLVGQVRPGLGAAQPRRRSTAVRRPAPRLGARRRPRARRRSRKRSRRHCSRSKAVCSSSSRSRKSADDLRSTVQPRRWRRVRIRRRSRSACSSSVAGRSRKASMVAETWRRRTVAARTRPARAAPPPRGRTG